MIKNAKNFLFFLLFSLILSGCSQNYKQSKQISTLLSASNKIDPFLKIKIQQTENKNPEKLLPVFIQTKNKITEMQKHQLASSGVQIHLIIGNIITASIPCKDVLKTANLKFVVYIQLSKTEQLQ